MSLYFIALIPDAPLREKIRSIKESIKEKYKAKHALKLPAHITIQIPFKLASEEEEKLIKILENFAEMQERFKVELSGFGAFPPRVLFIKIKEHRPIKNLHHTLQELLSKNFYLQEREKTKEIYPHITLATRDLSKENFSIAWAAVKEKEFNETFLAKSLSLLKHNGKTWDILEEFSFRV